MVEASFLAAFFGGLLSLFSPCSALLLPAFFAYAFGSGRELLGRTAVLYLGLCTTLVPLGMGISAVSWLFYGERERLVLVAGLVVIALGAVQILAGGRLPSGPLGRLRGLATRGDSVAAVYVLGAVYGLAGFCSGPILGAVLTVAAFSGEPARGALLLSLYALGMAAPLFLLALLWDRLNLKDRRWLRGRELSLGPLRVHSANLISGLMFVVLGVAFIVYEGTSSLEGLYERTGVTGLALYAEERVGTLTRGVPDWVTLAALVVALALAVGLALRRRVRGKKEAGQDRGKVLER
ncbi:MAG: cytochrome c biogenesis CcdA family protein [Rubrobacter sp.]